MIDRKSVINMKLKKFICLVLAVLLAFSASSMNIVAFAGSGYPDGVTEKQAQNAVTGTEQLVSYILKNYLKTDMKTLIEPMIYSDEVVSELLISIYSSMEETASDLKTIGIDVTVSGVAKGLKNYPDVQKALINAGSFQSVDLTDVKWGVNDKKSFSRAISATLSPFNNLLFMLLCSGKYNLAGITTIKGGNGYETAIVPFLNALGCEVKLTQEEFIQKVKEIHGDRYDYSKVEYVNYSTKICIICHEKDEFGEEHGEFWITPGNFLKNRNCPKCSKRERLTKDSFIKKAKSIHGDKYDYSKAEVYGVDSKIIIICPIHGPFEQTPYKHIQRQQGCPTCGNIQKGLSQRFSQVDFLDKARHIHGWKYDYSKIKYEGVDTKVCIICPTHGEFWQTPYTHINQKCGCPNCKSSKLEDIIFELLISLLLPSSSLV